MRRPCHHFQTQLSIHWAANRSWLALSMASLSLQSSGSGNPVTTVIPKQGRNASFLDSVSRALRSRIFRGEHGSLYMEWEIFLEQKSFPALEIGRFQWLLPCTFRYTLSSAGCTFHNLSTLFCNFGSKARAWSSPCSLWGFLFRRCWLDYSCQWLAFLFVISSLSDVIQAFACTNNYCFLDLPTLLLLFYPLSVPKAVPHSYQRLPSTQLLPHFLCKPSWLLCSDSLFPVQSDQQCLPHCWITQGAHLCLSQPWPHRDHLCVFRAAHKVWHSIDALCVFVEWIHLYSPLIV